MDRRRQNRVSVSCKECRTRKLRCDRARPCARCVQAGRETRCFYDSSSRPVDGQLVFTVDRQRAGNQPSPGGGAGSTSAKGSPHPPPGHMLDHQHGRPAPPGITSHPSQQGQNTLLPPLSAGVALRAGPQVSPTPGTLSIPGVTSNPALKSPSFDVPQRQSSPEPSGSVTQLQMLWHGSRSVDTYIEPVHGRTISTPKEVMFGENDATVYWGRSHETNFVPRITDVTRFLLKPEAISTIGAPAAAADNTDVNESNEVSNLLQVERNTRPGETVPVRLHDPELRALLPPRPDIDNLVERYMQIFEAQYKIIHVPTFRRDYARFWSADPVSSDYGPPTFLAQLLSICAIGSAFVTTAVVTPSAKTTTMENYAATRAGQWIEAVRLWLFKQDPRMQMSLGHLQAHLLMLVAGDVHWIKIDRSWISSGMLVRNAISAGLHREPSDFTRIAPFYAEMRRRLWYAILEFDLEASFAKGRTPSVREDDYDCLPPLPIYDDTFLSEEMTEDAIKLAVQQSANNALSSVRPSTPSSNNGSSPHSPSLPLYVCLARTIALRSQVCRTVNGIRLTRDYGQILKLDAKLQDFVAKADCATNPDSSDDTSRGKSVFLRILSRRATVALHAPFLPRALYDARYLYSRKLCVETATTVLTEALSLLDGGSSESALIFAVINNICRCEITNSVFLLCHDLLAQAVKRRRIHQQMAVTTSTDPEWQQEKLRLTSVVELIERTAQATAAICKPDIVSQRTCAWMQLSAELSRAAVGDDTMTAAVMKASIGRSIQSYQASIQQHAGSIDATGLNEVDASFFSRFTGSDTVLDDDYFNLFFNVNNFDMTMANQWV